MKNQNNSFMHLKSTLYFIAFLLLSPFFFTLFTLVTLYHKIKLLLLSKRFRYLDFARSNSIRTLMDTSRNPGILHFIVKVKGKCDLDEIRAAYQQHLLNKRDRNGKVVYPRLKAVLISCYGKYAFLKNLDDFKIENHIIMGPTSFKGRLIDENNIQKCISSVVSKYMPSDYSPWQIKIIPFGDDSSYYLLIRIHHLILDEQKNLTIGDMILLNRTKETAIKHVDFCGDKEFLKTTPLDNIVKRPTNMLTMFDDAWEFISNYWNEFIFKHDSLDHFDREGARRPDSLSKLSTSLIMTMANVHHDYRQQARKVLRGSSDPLLHFRFICDLVNYELKSRKISFMLLFELTLQFLHPVNLVVSTTKLIMRTIFLWILLSPFYIVRELNALRKLIFYREDMDTNSFCGFMCNYIPLCYGAIKEFFYFAKIIFEAPRVLIEELLFTRDADSHYLNNSLCGRKLISWSECISIEELKSKATQNQQAYSELMLATVSKCVLNFYKALKKEGKTQQIPSSIKLNYRNVAFSYLFGMKRAKRNGVIGLKLPLQSSRVSSQYKQIRDQIEQARRQQTIIYILSLVQINFDVLTTIIPSIYLKLIINYLSRKFSLSVTEVLGIDEIFEPNEYITCYNAKIEDVIFFRTPQANNSTSIIVQRFKNRVRINVMCDSNIENQHYISSGFKNTFYKMPSGGV